MRGSCDGIKYDLVQIRAETFYPGQFNVNAHVMTLQLRAGGGVT